MQRVHEEHGRERVMATVSRRLLLLAAILLLAVGLGINLASGGSKLLVVASGFILIFVIFAWSLFDASSNSTKLRGSTPIQPNYSSGKAISNLQSVKQEQDLPDPLESGFDIPLM